QPEVPPRTRRLRSGTRRLRARRSHPRGAGGDVAGRSLLHRVTATTIAGVAIGTARQDWEQAARELETYKDDARRYRRVLTAVEAVTAELRARVGQTFTLQELATAYADSDRWARAAISERAAYEGWPRDVALATDAAFQAYARGAIDFEP